MKITFCLRDPKAKGETPIHAFVHFDNRQLKLSTFQKIPPKNWNQERRRVKRGATGEAVINSALAKMESDLRSIFATLAATGVEPAPDVVKERYGLLTGRVTAAGPAPDLLTAYDQYLDRSGFRPATNVNHRKAKNHLKKFGESYGLKLTFDRLDRLFWERFGSYLLNVQKMTNDSAWNVIKSVRAFLADAVERGLTSTDEFRKVTRSSLPKGETSDKPYLSAEELVAVRSLDLSDNPRLDRVRDLFVFLCYTGIRFGDSQRLRPENVEGGVLRIVLEKNRKRIAVGLPAPALRVLEKYGGALPRISNQKANEYLSDVLEAAGVNSPCPTVAYVGVERREKVVPKFELCGMHTAKRTFVTLQRIEGTSVESLMKVTGNSRATLERYMLRSDEEALREVVDAWS